MKPLSEIVLGFSDAENYRRRENKDLFNQIFLHNESLDELCKPNIFFLLGEKGTGKTAYAVYFSNTKYKNNNSIHKFIRETDYQKFISLKQKNNLTLSDYTSIWKVIIYLLLSDEIYKRVGTTEFLLKYKKFKALHDAVNEYYKSAFSPEIITALQFVENSGAAADIMLKHLPVEGKIQASESTSQTTQTSNFQTNLLILERKFEECLSSLHLSQNFLLFIDGIDIRPSAIPFAEYLDCVKGLANAVWSLNNDYFPSIRDTKGKLRIVLLVRPDIFNSLGLQNRNTKLKDNSLILDWRTNYPVHRSSDIFRMADRLFAAQQDEKLPVGVAWDHYFPFSASSVHSDLGEFTSFVVFLRYSFYRPRDILTILDLLNRVITDKSDPKRVFQYEDFYSGEFKRSYGDYLLGEIKDSLSFYYSEEEFEAFLKFFEFLQGARKFDYALYLIAYGGFTKFMLGQGGKLPAFMKSAEEFLQFLYDLNIICFFEKAEDETFIRWCFKERSLTNISPKVKTDMVYEIHYGLATILNTGKKLRSSGASRTSNRNSDVRQETDATNIGTIKSYFPAKRFGFIQQIGLPVDIFFSERDVIDELRSFRPGVAVKYTLGKDNNGRLIAKTVSLVKTD